jgi:phosphoribosylglycinamide formyltransferase-1
MYKVAVLSSTNGTNFQSLLDAKKSGVLKDNVEIACLVTNKADCGAAEKAKVNDIPVHFVDTKGKTREEFDAEVMIILGKYNIDLVVLGGYMRIISKLMVNKYKNRMINVHPSLLPRYGGGMNLGVHRAVIDAGEKETGMTIHILDEGVDTGPIVLQRSCPVDPDDTPEALKDRVQALEREWYPKVVQMFADGKIKVENNKVTIKHEN